MVSYPEGFDNCSVFVNGVDITNNTEETDANIDDLLNTTEEDMENETTENRA